MDATSWRVAATDHSLISATGGWRSEPIVVCMRLVCKHRDQVSRGGMWQLPSGQSHAHFAEREQESRPGISILRILGMGSHTKIPGIGFETRILKENFFSIELK